MRIGYARVSTDDQHLDLQRDALTKAECDKIFADKISGAKSDRPGLKAALEYVREGGALVVWRLDRLGTIEDSHWFLLMSTTFINIIN